MKTESRANDTEGEVEKIPGVVDYLMKPLALVVIAGVSGGFVWSVHTGDIILICLTFFFGGSVGLFTGLVVGVTLAETILTIGGLTGLFSGIVWGFAAYGWIGVVLGGPLGLVAGAIASIPMMFLIILVLSLGTGSTAGKESRQ
jgi:hypothetical protein